MRQVYLADILEEKGQEVKRYGLETETESSASLKEVLETADVIAAPVPFLKKDVVFCKNPQEKFQTELQRENILKLVRPGSVLFAGGIPAEYEKKAAKKGIVCVDYLKDEQWRTRLRLQKGFLRKPFAAVPGIFLEVPVWCWDMEDVEAHWYLI